MHDNDQQLRLPLPAAYPARNRELPQRLLGILLWTALVLLLWALGAH